ALSQNYLELCYSNTVQDTRKINRDIPNKLSIYLIYILSIATSLRHPLTLYRWQALLPTSSFQHLYVSLGIPTFDIDNNNTTGSPGLFQLQQLIRPTMKQYLDA